MKSIHTLLRGIFLLLILQFFWNTNRTPAAQMSHGDWAFYLIAIGMCIFWPSSYKAD